MGMIVSLSVELLPTDDGERPTKPNSLCFALPTSKNFKSCPFHNSAIDSTMKISQFQPLEVR
jgi:hypothetical protein